MSDISSAGSNGKTCRQDVLRGVDVPVVPGAAGRADPCPGAEGEFREQVPAGGAGLAARVAPVDHDQAPPGPGCLVLELAAELTPAAVRDRLGERPGCGPCSSRPGPRSRSRRGRGPAGRRCGAGNPSGRRGSSGARGRPWPWPWPGSPSLSGSGPGAAGNGPGCVPAGRCSAGSRIFCPSLVTAKSLMPRSTPTTAPAAGSCAGSGTSTAKETYQRPHGSRDTVTVLGSSDAGSRCGHDQANASGVPSWRGTAARRGTGTPSACTRRTAARRGTCTGGAARPAKKAAYAACWWRIACCSGTQDTSPSQPSSSVAFIAVR